MNPLNLFKFFAIVTGISNAPGTLITFILHLFFILFFALFNKDLAIVL